MRPHLYLVRGDMPKSFRTVSDEWRDAIDDYCASQRVAGHSPGTISLRRRYLDRLAETAPRGPFEMTPGDLVAFLDQPWKPETRKSARTTLCSFYRWAMDNDLMTADPAYRLPAVHVPAGKPHPVPDSFITAAMAKADARGKVMIMFAAFMGMRRAEIAKVHSRDIEGDTLRIVGKGGRTRVIPIPSGLALALTGIDGYIFPGRHDGHLSPNRVGIILRGLLGRYSAHTMRHRLASTIYEQTRDILTVKEILGHSSLVTTQIYTAVPDGALRAAIEGATKLSA